MPGMDSYGQAAVERAMKVEEVMLQAMGKKITWWQAAEILGTRPAHAALVGALLALRVPRIV